MTWTLAKQTHAVERVRFEVRFVETLPKKALDSLGLMFDGKNDLRFGPREVRQSATFMIGPDGQAQMASGNVQQHAGWVSTRVATKHNLPLEAVVFDPAMLVYESSDYRGWTKAIDRYQSVCGAMLDEAGKLVNVAMLVHDYVDRFVFLGEPQDAVPTDILKAEMIAQMPAEVRTGSSLWHIHRGWFETIDGDDFLVNQNFDAQEVTTPGGKVARSLQIYTKLEFRPNSVGVEVSDISSRWEAMHRRCNALVCAALNQETAARVGLKRSDDATSE